ncbi:plasmid pRiA4b ORF-3 family protein [Bradyrhizobium sp. Ai1a-2]|nr:plasmid pRiA4b ORF-3 family protein [Bradyrhizobium sp. Ai1a-2]
MRCLVVPLTLRLDRLHLTLQAGVRLDQQPSLRVPGWRRTLGHP